MEERWTFQVPHKYLYTQGDGLKNAHSRTLPPIHRVVSGIVHNVILFCIHVTDESANALITTVAERVYKHAILQRPSNMPRLGTGRIAGI